MRALVQQDSPALARPGRAPAAGPVVGFRAEPVGDRPRHPPDFSQLAALHERADLLENRIRALVEHRGKNLLLRPVRRDEPLAIRLVDGDRLLDKHVQPGLQRCDSDGRVGIVGSGHENRVHLAGGDQGVAVRAAKNPGVFRDFLQNQIADAGEPAARNVSRQNRGRMRGSHVSKSDDAKAEFFHKGIKQNADHFFPTPGKEAKFSDCDRIGAATWSGRPSSTKAEACFGA